MTDADLTKLQKIDRLSGSLADRVHTVLKKAILDLDFPPGTVIRKRAVGDQLGISRSPVSDALLRLSGEGLVDIVPQSSTRVSRLSIAAIKEDAFLREALEVAAVGYAASHRSDETLARLKRNIEMQKLLIGTVDHEDFLQTDKAFHETIIATTQVTRMPAVVQSVSPHLNRARHLLLPEPGRLADTVTEHIKIYEAIRKQDSKAAEVAMRQHVRQLLKRLKPLEDERPDLYSP